MYQKREKQRTRKSSIHKFILFCFCLELPVETISEIEEGFQPENILGLYGDEFIVKWFV